MMFTKLGLAIAFSPRAEALLAETVRLKNLFQAELVLIHVGRHRQEENDFMQALLAKAGLSSHEVTLCWREGKPAEEILKACTEQGVDLLIAGALKKEGLVQHYVGSVARKILRKSDCSVLTLVHPSTQPAPFMNIVVDAEERKHVNEALRAACRIAQLEKAKWVHVVSELKLYGLTMSTAGQDTEAEYLQLKQNLIETEVDNVQKRLSKIPHEGLKINIKLLSGKSGFETAQFARRKQADLLVVGAPPRRLSLLDRVFPHDLEYIFADLPCNLLVVHPSTSTRFL
jgi:nucleotide-binding universal stress UspA family protein